VSDRQVVLDTETTGLEPRLGHRIIEIGCVEVVNRKLTGNTFHMYLNPEREIDAGAIEVHGISNEFLIDKALFADIYEQFLSYIKGAQLIIHNAAFDVGFLNAELQRITAPTPSIAEICTVHDTLLQARKMFPGQRNDLDSLCKRYDINNSHRELHGALLDAEILADVYLLMSGGQAALSLDASAGRGAQSGVNNKPVDFSSLSLPLIKPSHQEAGNHVDWLARLDESVEGECVWSKLNSELKH
jgi:DNA polymerase-3 subunit epsilon